MKILIITGSGGLIGSEAVNFFHKKYDKVIGIDNNQRSKFFGMTWHTVISAWELPPAEDFYRYKSYFNSLVKTELKEIDEAAAKEVERKEKAS